MSGLLFGECSVLRLCTPRILMEDLGNLASGKT